MNFFDDTSWIGRAIVSAEESGENRVVVEVPLPSTDTDINDYIGNISKRMYGCGFDLTNVVSRPEVSSYMHLTYRGQQ